jgi:CheY-like chemotaxis protein
MESELPGAIEPIPAGDWSYVEVIDKGIGMTPETQAKIFQPFFTTKPPDRGTGLGLSTVVSIVRQAQGRIALSSIPGAGTTMQLLFPRTSSAQALAAKESVQAPSKRMADLAYDFPFEHKNRTVLLVVNDDSVRAIVEALLDRAGYRITSASQPGEALLLAEKTSCTPDIIVADCLMPLMSGPELASRLRSTFPDLPALYLRGTDLIAEDESEESRMPASTVDYPSTRDTLMDVYLQKPFREEELVGALDSMLQDSD